jgi:hypothetical protein
MTKYSCTFHVIHSCTRCVSSMYHAFSLNAWSIREESVNVSRDGALLMTSRSPWFHDAAKEEGAITMILVTDCKMSLGISPSECRPCSSSSTRTSCREGISRRHRIFRRISPTSVSSCKDGSSATESSLSRFQETLYDGSAFTDDRSWRTSVRMDRNRDIQGIL